MFNNGETYYSEDHSISFGQLITRSSGGVSYEDFTIYANTWADWHLIPSSRPSVAHPSFVTKYVEIPGTDDVLDLSTYLTGRVNYGQRQGSFEFQVANGIEDWETIRSNMVRMLHGKKIKMRLNDDPEYYYEGRFTVGQWETGATNSSISIQYQLSPYKMRIAQEGSSPKFWDTFNFERDYDYYTVMSPLVINGAATYTIDSGDYSFAPVVSWVSGNTTVTFGGVTQSLSYVGSKTLGQSVPGRNILSVSGNGSVTIIWRGGAL